jgi:Ca2+-binding EF-hand superfamily protein
MKKTLVIGLSLCLAGVVFAADGEKKGANPETPRDETLKKYDKNKNGKLDQSEREEWRKDREAEVVKKHDKNGDGKLDASEREAARAERRKAGEDAKPKENK